VQSIDARVQALREQYAEVAADAARLRSMPFLSGEEAEGLRADQAVLADIRGEVEGLGGSFQDAQEGA
jgi:hypothetical protein